MWVQNNAAQKIYLNRMFDPTKLVQKNFWKKKIGVKKVNRFEYKKYFWSKKYLGQKKFCSTKILAPKI